MEHMLTSILAVLVGLVVLIAASDRLVVSAVRVSQALGLSPVLIGALVVGLGTSLPEMLVSSLASLDGELDIAMGNVVGSNIANVTLVLGAAGMYRVLTSRIEVLRREGVLMLLAVIALAAVMFDGRVDRLEGIGLLTGMLVALVLLIRWSRGTDASAVVGGEIEEVEPAARGNAVEIMLGIGALVATVVGANILLDGALDLGERLELSATFLGVMLGVGTSLPELATAVAAARRSAPDLVVGNVVGSNLFNSLAVAGLAAVVGPATLADLDRVDLGWMVGAVLVAGLFARTDRIERSEAVVLFVAFFVYLGFSL
jgi:cation:H+ antiporter